MTDDRLKTKAQKFRVNKEKDILDQEARQRKRIEMQEAGGSTNLAPLPKEYQKRLRKGKIEEIKISLQGEMTDEFDPDLSRKLDAIEVLEEE